MSSGFEEQLRQTNKLTKQHPFLQIQIFRSPPYGLKVQNKIGDSASSRMHLNQSLKTYFLILHFPNLIFELIILHAYTYTYVTITINYARWTDHLNCHSSAKLEKLFRQTGLLYLDPWASRAMLTNSGRNAYRDQGVQTDKHV